MASRDISPERIVAAVVENPQLLPEIYRKMGWLNRAALLAARDTIDKEITRQEDLLAACREGRFGRDYMEPRMVEAMRKTKEAGD